MLDECEKNILHHMSQHYFIVEKKKNINLAVDELLPWGSKFNPLL